MTHLNIQQGLNIEVVSTNLIKKLYEVALSVPEPLEGELDAAYMSGNLLVDKSYRSYVEYLTNRFDDLHINVTAGYYMLFHDSAVNDVLKDTIGDGVGVLIEEFLSITNDSLLGLGSNATAHPEITDFREGCLLTGLTSLSTGFAALSGVTTFGFPPNVVNYPGGSFASNIRFDGVVVKNINNFINRNGTNLWFVNGYYLYDMDNNGNLTRIDTLTLPSAVSFPNGSNKDCLCGVKLEELIIPSSCTYITSLSGPYLKKISFESPSSLTTIEANTFWYGPSWTNSTVLLNVANLPLTITTIGNNAFRSCSNITGVLDLPNLTSLGYLAFYATGVTEVTDLGSITEIPKGAFQNCTNLSKIKLPTTVTSLNEFWSRNISSTLYISGLDNVSNHSTYNWDLYNTTILNPIKISVITGDSIVSWSNNNSVVIRVHSYYEPLRTSTRQNNLAIYGAPKNTLFIYNCLGGTGSFTIGLLYYRDITSFGTATFFRCNIENLVINNSTPPVLDNSDTTLSGEGYWLNWGNSIFGNQTSSLDPSLLEHAIIGTLWVPDSAVATYQADPLYSSLTIKGINTKTNGVDYDLPRYADFAAWEAAEEAAAAQGGHAPLGLIEAWM